MFQTTDNSVGGKWFALSRGHAMQWGAWFQAKTGIAHDRIIAVEVSEDLYRLFEPVYPNLDGIGPACFADIDLLRDKVFDEVLE